LRHSTTTKTFRFVIEGEEMRNVYTFAGLTFALALAFSITTAAQTSNTESKQKASPDQSQTQVQTILTPEQRQKFAQMRLKNLGLRSQRRITTRF
jgi:hypothetical protein